MLTLATNTAIPPAAHRPPGGPILVKKGEVDTMPYFQVLGHVIIHLPPPKKLRIAQT